MGLFIEGCLFYENERIIHKQRNARLNGDLRALGRGEAELEQALPTLGRTDPGKGEQKRKRPPSKPTKVHRLGSVAVRDFRLKEGPGQTRNFPKNRQLAASQRLGR